MYSEYEQNDSKDKKMITIICYDILLPVLLPVLSCMRGWMRQNYTDTESLICSFNWWW